MTLHGTSTCFFSFIAFGTVPKNVNILAELFANSSYDMSRKCETLLDFFELHQSTIRLYFWKSDWNHSRASNSLQAVTSSCLTFISVICLAERGPSEISIVSTLFGQKHSWFRRSWIVPRRTPCIDQTSLYDEWLQMNNNRRLPSDVRSTE